MEIIYHIHAPVALTPGKEFPVPTECEAEWGPIANMDVLGK